MLYITYRTGGRANKFPKVFVCGNLLVLPPALIAKKQVF